MMEGGLTQLSSKDVGMTNGWDPGLVSVIIPCHNAAPYLGTAISSALAQTYPLVEVIVVDDGSTDRSREVAASFGSRITLLTRPHWGGNVARNCGIWRARGEFIVLLDADDVLAPSCVASRVRVLQADPGIGLVAGYFREIDPTGAPLGRIPELRRIGSLPPFRQAVRRNWGPSVGWMFRRAAYDRCGGFDPLLRSCQDWDFVLRVALRYRMGYVPTAEAFYRKVPGSVSSDPGRMLAELRRMQRKTRAYAEHPLQYWFDCRCGQFELGRRILYEALFGTSGACGLARTARLVAKHRSLVWIGAVAALTFVAGKRASARPGTVALAAAEPV